MKPEEEFVRGVRAFVERHRMFGAGERIGVAVSGGADSVALLRLLHEFAAVEGWPLTVLHMNHGLRGAESDGDEAFVAGVTSDLGLAMVTGRGRTGPGGNLEQRLRQERSEFLEQARCERGLAKIALGHTASDQAETVLFRLLRGTGPEGLGAMPPLGEDGRARPLLAVKRNEVREWLRSAGWTWREDRSNEDRRHARNRMRLDLIPLLEQEWNPELVRGLVRLAELSREDAAYWRESVEVPEVRRGAVVLKARTLADEPAALASRRVRALFAAVKGSRNSLEADHVRQVLDLARQEAGTGGVDLPGLRVERSFGWLRFSTSPAVTGFRREVVAPGRYPVPGGALTLEIRQVAGQSEYNTGSSPGSWLDWDRVAGPLELRSWRRGDVFRPTGRTREYKVHDLFQQARIPVWERGSWPMIEGKGRILWMRGFGVGEGLAPGRSTAVALGIKEEEDAGNELFEAD